MSWFLKVASFFFEMREATVVQRGTSFIETWEPSPRECAESDEWRVIERPTKYRGILVLDGINLAGPKRGIFLARGSSGRAYHRVANSAFSVDEHVVIRITLLSVVRQYMLAISVV
jgi:hypothetical protein